MFKGRAARHIGRRGPAQVGALAALAVLGCTAPAVQPPATPEALRRLAALAPADVYGRPVALGPLLDDRAIVYVFRTGCAYCAADLAAAPTLAASSGFPPLILVARESASRLRAALGPRSRPNLVVISDSAGLVTDGALPTRFVPRVLAVRGGRVRLDVTGAGGGIVRAARALGGRR